MTFKEAVETTLEVATGFQTGLTALGGYKTKISVSNTRLLEGSVDIDLCTTALYPNDNRWDYALAYDKQVYFVEVHTANTSEVSVVLKKLQWLKDWLSNQAPNINKLKAQAPYYWIQSNGFAIPKTSRQYRQISQAQLKPIKRLSL
ncbi:MAG: hypothetical protein LBO74_16685 [Candidatus Symbiothrix sp.]|jgi:hypothetical protein|nr:hypothetical protein [Candidatus Symbiothrix sp.]